MYSRSWQIIKDEVTKTFEVVTHASNDNAFTNKVYAMQKAGMNVNSVILPVSNRNANKASIKFTGYIIEEGLYDRLQKQLREISNQQNEFWDDEA